MSGGPRPMRGVAGSGLALMGKLYYAGARLSNLNQID
jgi:hypothetical protein